MPNVIERYRSNGISGLRILIIDDNPDDRLLLAEYLGGVGCRIFVACDGQDGFRKALAIIPDLILMDVGMPVCDGLTAMRLLRSVPDTRSIPICFLTAAGEPAERVQGLRLGAVDYVSKPFDLKEVHLRLTIHARAGRYAGGNNIAAGPGDTLDMRLFRDARYILLSRLHEAPPVSSLARTLSTNTLRLNLAFKRCTGMTVSQFLFERRMQYAKSLLRETALDIQTIAEAVGYGTRQNFSTAYRKRFGASPNESRIQQADI
ncbi:DNA-binding response regulator [Burkholderia vietnamiensis]|uniref:response regulator transcription factor n=1 Tax=Burkholderia vietnamiensis TaxID=60552 RepID=UPI001CB209B5|nr:DNA-binding response regulator [Burkholderia vietnamiensis]WHU95808.1 DNA-binding response regulator [Burkholderia vietnamiensis]CAG9200449.1 DNA-binding response regulator [Burkholderia vietnamiensis]